MVDARDAGRWDSRGHFSAAAAEAMRRILVENARRKWAEKRGGKLQRVELSKVDPAIGDADDEVLALNDAQEKLAESDREKQNSSSSVSSRG